MGPEIFLSDFCLLMCGSLIGFVGALVVVFVAWGKIEEHVLSHESSEQE